MYIADSILEFSDGFAEFYLSAMLTKSFDHNPPNMSTEIYPDELKSSEQALVKGRREIRGVDSNQPEVGLALSGGGIRSATFCLGMLQSLAREGFLKKVDFLSTISGGGYIGSFLGRLFTRLVKVEKPNDELLGVEDQLKNAKSKPLAYLRESGRYLSPNKGSSEMHIVAVYLRNWTAVHVTLGVLLLFIFLSLNVIRFGGLKWLLAQCGLWEKLNTLIHSWGWLEQELLSATLKTLWWSPWFVLPVAVLLLWVIPASWAFWHTQFAARMRAKSNGLPVLATILGVIAAFRVFSSSDFCAHYAPPFLAKDVTLKIISASVISTGIISLCMWGLSALAAMKRNPAVVDMSRDAIASLSQIRTRDVRNVLTNVLSTGMAVFVVLALVALVDTVAQSLYAMIRHVHEQPVFKLVLAVTGMGGIVALIVKYSSLLTAIGGKKDQKSTAWHVPLRSVGSAAGYLVALSVVIFWCCVAHAITWAGAEPYNGAAGVRLLKQFSADPPAIQLTEERLIQITRCPDNASGESLPNEEAQDHTCRIIVMNFAWVTSLIISWLIGWGVPFLNLSGLQSFYSARLTRAYLRASNPECDSMDIHYTDGYDDLPFKDYHPEKNGGPLHLIGTTFNETVSGRSQLEDRDRKGMMLAIGPAGMSCGSRYHAQWASENKNSDNKSTDSSVVTIRPPVSANDQEYHPFHSQNHGASQNVEALSLGMWTGISGAAFSTGMGANTTTGPSLLLAFANVRLGYYWDSRINPWQRSGRINSGSLLKKLWERMVTYCPVHSHLLYETLDRFHGPNRRLWYLSDGGHFENTGCYELLRRRLPIIICCDCGADPEYVFEDMSNLVRLARIDLNAQIDFFHETDFESIGMSQDSKGELGELRRCIGTFAEFQRKPDTLAKTGSADALRFKDQAYSDKHATLAWVKYDDDESAKSCIIFIKPTLTGDEPLDVQAYHAAHASFPQETTLDQFFDESQWESYRCLGEHIGNQLFGAGLNKLVKHLTQKFAKPTSAESM